MAIYHLHVDMVRRSSGRSSVAAAAYRSAEKLRSEHEGMTHDYSSKSSAVNAAAYRSGESLQNEQERTTHDYTRKQGVVHTEIMLPENAPREFKDRATLWNAVEKSEKRKDAQTARDIDIALPIELDRQEQILLVREYVKDNFVDKGMCADFAIHDKGDGNPHTHILLTTRYVTGKGFGKKNREWNKTSQLREWRENWASSCNERLKEHQKRIDHRTLKAQGIDREPTIHVGVSAKHMKQKGHAHERAEINRGIISRNTAKHMHELKEGYIALDKEISKLQTETAEARREMNSLRIKAEEMTERAEQIQAMSKRLDELKDRRQSMGFFERKKEIESQIQQHEHLLEQATAHFRRTYKFDLEQAQGEVAKLETAMTSKKHLQEKLQEKITPLAEEKEAFLLEYQWQKLYVELNPDRQRIYDRLDELEKDSHSVQDNLARLRCERALDVVTERNFQEIVRQAPPEKVQALLERKEQERELERLQELQRAFHRTR